MMGTLKTTFSMVVGDQVEISPVSVEVPFPFGPRHWGQSAAFAATAIAEAVKDFLDARHTVARLDGR